jgi:hypothetical protein
LFEPFDVSRILEICGFPVSLLHGDRLERLERSETVERLKRLEQDPFLVSIRDRDHYFARVEKGIRKILTGIVCAS